MFRRANEFEINSAVSGNNNVIENEMNVDIDMIQNNQATGNDMMAPSYYNSPIKEAVKEGCVHRTIVHEVPHICPIRTRIINHHIYKHTFTPCNTCCEENVVENIYDRRC